MEYIVRFTGQAKMEKEDIQIMSSLSDTLFDR
jgi:hypothetical protein